ncbi:50S ribosomal protein L22 [Candidatus Woesebacteria bacterium RIFCSPHIGHO2_01_FULL_37_10]|uniref:Large ribosomal subunit protein uL22 n=2 Tax=Candidatus Woeseibacteriota TaxID=1752722 RepID=A0A1F7XTN5_9BACT|nr:MAG: 50S ribosomal protein L22 [Candidatus Woesebacteria bacterium RIFCSPHIGHO2_01_FULL_37_10]
MNIKSTQKFVLTSPRKLREVVFMMGKMSPSEAFEMLGYADKRAAEPLRKVIGSAIGNAINLKLDPENLIFKEIQINEGPRLKRWRAGARGRAKPFKRRMSHIRVVLMTKPEAQSTKPEINSKVQNIKYKTSKKKNG